MTSLQRTVRGRDSAAAGRTNRWVALAVLSLAQLMVILDSTIVNIALPVARRSLGFSTDDRQWVVTGYALAFGSLLLLGGRLSDLFGRKRPFIIGVAGFGLASAAGGAATGFEMLLIARIAQGLLLGGILTQSVSWRWCLLVNLVIAVIALVGALTLLWSGDRPERVPLDVAGTVTAVLGLVTSYLHAHAAAVAQPATIAGATIASYHLVFWIAAAVFLVSGAVAALLFRSGPLTVDSDAAVVAVP